MFHSSYRIILLSILLVLSYAHQCAADLLMISQEKKLQISSDDGVNWRPHDISLQMKHIDFLDLHHDHQDKTLYILGYNPIDNTMVLLIAHDMERLFFERINIPILLDTDNEYIEFMKIRTTNTNLHLFGRFNTRGYYNQYFNHSDKKSVHLMKKKRSDVVGNVWHHAKELYPLFYDMSYTMLNVLYSDRTKTDYLYFISDQQASGRYPFKASSTQYATLLGVYHRHGFSKIAAEIKIHQERYPIAVQNQTTEQEAILGGQLSTGIFSTNGETEHCYQNSAYQNLGTMLFTKGPHHLFFVTKKHEGVKKAVLAYGPNPSTLTDSTILDESLNIPYLTRAAGVEALENNSFYRFVEGHKSHLFFLTYQCTKGHFIALTLKSIDGGQSWSPLKTATPLPQGVREIIKFTPKSESHRETQL